MQVQLQRGVITHRPERRMPKQTRRTRVRTQIRTPIQRLNVSRRHWLHPAELLKPLRNHHQEQRTPLLDLRAMTRELVNAAAFIQGTGASMAMNVNSAITNTRRGNEKTKRARKRRALTMEMRAMGQAMALWQRQVIMHTQVLFLHTMHICHSIKAAWHLHLEAAILRLLFSGLTAFLGKLRHPCRFQATPTISLQCSAGHQFLGSQS